MIAQILGHAMLEESQLMNLPSRPAKREKLPKRGEPPEPLYLNKTMADFYDTVKAQRISFGGDESNPKGGKPEILLSAGFNSMGDADAPGAVLQIGIPLRYHEDRQQRLVNIGYKMQFKRGAFRTSYMVAP